MAGGYILFLSLPVPVPDAGAGGRWLAPLPGSRCRCRMPVPVAGGWHRCPAAAAGAGCRCRWPVAGTAARQPLPVPAPVAGGRWLSPLPGSRCPRRCRRRWPARPVTGVRLSASAGFPARWSGTGWQAAARVAGTGAGGRAMPLCCPVGRRRWPVAGVRLSVSVCLPYLSVYQSINHAINNISTYLSICLSIYLSIYLI